MLIHVVQKEELIEFEHIKEEERIKRGMIEKEVCVWRERALVPGFLKTIFELYLLYLILLLLNY